MTHDIGRINSIVSRLRNSYAPGVGLSGAFSKEDALVLVAEVERLRAERAQLFRFTSEWGTALFFLRQRVMSELGSFDSEVSDRRKAWFEEHGYTREETKDG